MRSLSSKGAVQATDEEEYIRRVGLHRESDEAVLAKKRVMIVEQRASTARERSQKEGVPIG